MLAADLAASRKKGDVDAGEVVLGEIAHGDLLVAEVDFAAGRTLARQRHELADRKLALGENRKQRLTDGAGRTDHGNLVLRLACHSRFPGILGCTSPTSAHCA